MVLEMGLAHARIPAKEIWEGWTEAAGEAVGFAPGQLYINISNYYARTAISNAYGVRAVDHRGKRPPR